MGDNGAMQRRIGLVIAWLAATGLSVFIATQAVGAVRDQVTTPPATLASLPATAGDTTTTTSTTTTQPATTSTTTTTDAGSTTTGSTSTSATTTTVPPTTTTTTTAPLLEFDLATYQLSGGWVRIRYSIQEVNLVDAGPYAGFSMKIEKTGPDEVEVEFEGESYEATFRARIVAGVLDVSVSEDDD